MPTGFLKIQLFATDGAMPVGYTTVLVRKCIPSGNELLFTLKTDENGNTPTIELPAPPKEYSLDPNNTEQPFACYNVEVKGIYGFRSVVIHDVQVFEGQTAILPVHLTPLLPEERDLPDEIHIPRQHGLDATDHGNNPYPDVWPDDSFGNPFDTPQNNMPNDTQNTQYPEAMQFPLANEVQIPRFITVHLGRPNVAARNVRVPFIDYIKNVASSEIYPTWHESALRANIHAQISFALNRMYTYMSRKR